VLAIDDAGHLYAWENNRDGQLGDGSAQDRPALVHIGEEKDRFMVAAGASHSLALKADGASYTWNPNNYGTLNNGSQWMATPVLIDQNP
jgi:alpha-tubulin suppressor-like RCC1 family protein